MSKPVDELQGALMMTGLVQPVSSNQKGGWLEVLCRQIPGQERPWLAAVEALLEVAEVHGLSDALILARRYLRRDGRMVFGWYLSLGLKNTKELAAASAHLIRTLEGFRPSLSADQPSANKADRAKAAGPPIPVPHRPEPAAVRAMTNATARPPSDGKDPVPPNGRAQRAITTKAGSDGRAEVLEIPLPHTYGELNKPKDGSTKGARKIG
jgi:hypothetical protein